MMTVSVLLVSTAERRATLPLVRVVRNGTARYTRFLLLLFAIAMIFLKDNVLLERDLTFNDIKPRLLGIKRKPWKIEFNIAYPTIRSLGYLSRLGAGLCSSKPACENS